MALVVFLGATGAAFSCRYFRSRASNRPAIDIRPEGRVTSVHFLRSLVFRPEEDRIATHAFTAYSKEHGTVIVSWKRNMDGLAAQQCDALLQRSVSSLKSQNVGYSFFGVLASSIQALDVQVTFLNQLSKHAAKKALSKRFPTPTKPMIETFVDYEQFLEDRGGREALDSENAWIPPILSGEKEADRAIAQNEYGSLSLHPYSNFEDPKKTQRLLFIFADGSLRSIRDLRQSHLPLLRGVRAMIHDELKTSLGADYVESEWLLYFHYRPTFWWLHIHVGNSHHHSYGGARNILLDEVVRSIEAIPDYMQQAQFVVPMTESEIEKKHQRQS